MTLTNMNGSLYWGAKNLTECIEESSLAMNENSVTLYEGSSKYNPRSALFHRRTITLHDEVNKHSAASLMEQLLALDTLSENPEEIIFYINSPGGSVVDGLMIYDTMQHITSDVSTVVTGIGASMASILSIAGTKGKRYALPHATIMLHEARGGKVGKVSEQHTHLDYTDRMLENLINIYIKHMNRNDEGKIFQFGGKANMNSLTEIIPTPMEDEEVKAWLMEWLEKDRYMSPEQALQLGLIDGVLYPEDKQDLNSIK